MEQPGASPEPLPYDSSCRRIQVSREKRPLNFFVTLSKKFLTTDDVVELSGLGLAVTTVVTIAEILKSSGYVSLEHIQTSLVEPHPDGHTTAPKAKIQIWIRKTAQFDSLMTNHNSHHMRSNASTSGAVQSTESGGPSQLEAGNTNPGPGAEGSEAQGAAGAAAAGAVAEGAGEEAADVAHTALQSKS